MGHCRQGLMFCGYYHDGMGVVSELVSPFFSGVMTFIDYLKRENFGNIQSSDQIPHGREIVCRYLGIYQPCCMMALTLLQLSCLKTYLCQRQVRDDMQP